MRPHGREPLARHARRPGSRTGVIGTASSSHHSPPSRGVTRPFTRPTACSARPSTSRHSIRTTQGRRQRGTASIAWCSLRASRILIGCGGRGHPRHDPVRSDRAATLRRDRGRGLPRVPSCSPSTLSASAIRDCDGRSCAKWLRLVSLWPARSAASTSERSTVHSAMATSRSTIGSLFTPAAPDRPS